jgi:hypothetical protein
MGLFMVTAGLAAVYGITTFGPKLSSQNKIKGAYHLRYYYSEEEKQNRSCDGGQ